MKQVLTISILLNLIGFMAIAEEIHAPTVVKEEAFITSKDLERIIPTNMPATNNPSEVGNKIADQGMDVIFNSKAIQSMPVTKVVQKLDLEQAIKFGSKENVEHKIGLRVLALQRMARLEYSGFLSANAAFSASDQSIDFNLVEELSQKSKLFINMNTVSQTSTANIQWEWP